MLNLGVCQEEPFKSSSIEWFDNRLKCELNIPITQGAVIDFELWELLSLSFIFRSLFALGRVPSEIM